jgi:hypothetical protein
MIKEGISIYRLYLEPSLLIFLFIYDFNPSYENFMIVVGTNEMDVDKACFGLSIAGVLCRMCPLAFELCQSPLFRQGPLRVVSVNDILDRGFIGSSGEVRSR